jgi:D-aminopeptidase
MGEKRARDLGVNVGNLRAGPNNAITDVEGVRVGHSTIIRGEGPLVVGEGPVRTGVTVVCPREGFTRENPVFAGSHRFNGNGEMTGLEWVRESGQLTTPVAITNTHSVGIVRDALVAADMAHRDARGSYWSLPVVAETYDGALNDINGMHVTAEHVREALASASDGPVPEGGVGGGTGMVCHEFKGGTGTASRAVNGWHVGALVQSNYGDREHLTIDGVPVGREIPRSAVSSPWDDEEAVSRRGAGSIIVVLATDAPLLPHQLQRLAQRAGLGIARMGGSGGHSSGDIFLAFSTANADVLTSYKSESPTKTFGVTMVADGAMSDLFWGVIESTEEAICNALVAAETTTGRDGITAHALPHDVLVDVMTRYGRGPSSR